MKCPQCQSTKTIKNGRRRSKQCYGQLTVANSVRHPCPYKCRECGRQFVESPIIRSYPLEVKQLCLKMYLNGMGLRGIERVTEIHHTTVMHWVREAQIKAT